MSNNLITAQIEAKAVVERIRRSFGTRGGFDPVLQVDALAALRDVAAICPRCDGVAYEVSRCPHCGACLTCG